MSHFGEIALMARIVGEVFLGCFVLRFLTVVVPYAWRSRQKGTNELDAGY